MVATLRITARDQSPEQFSFDATFTPSGVVRIGRLQSRENYAYIKP